MPDAKYRFWALFSPAQLFEFHIFDICVEASADAIYRGGGFERLAAIFFAAAAC